MKKSIVLLFTFCLLMQAKAQSIYYSCDFESGKPKSMTFYDLDGLPVNPDLTKVGFGTYPWVILKMSESEPNNFIASTSSFYQGGTANDWMITPPISLYSTGAELSWKGIVCDNSDKRDGYKVLVSTKGTDTQNFETVYTVKAESSDDWVTHSVNLDKYAGETVWIAFVNNSTNKYVLGIDDIQVSGPEIPARFTTATPRYTNEAKTAVKIEVIANSPEPLRAFTAYCSVNGKTFSKEFSGLNLKRGESAEFELDEKISLEKGKSTDYKLWIRIGEKELAPWEYSISRLLFQPEQKVLIENLTATWDGASILGLTALDFLKEKYKDRIICSQVHRTFGFYDEPMKYDAYYNVLNKYKLLDQFGLLNRKHRVTPLVKLDDTNYTTLVGKEGDYGYETALLKELQEGTYADIDVTGEFTDKTSGEFKIRFKIEATFAIDVQEADYRFAAVLVEKNVHREYDSYAQSNYYSEYEGGVLTSEGMQPGMGGYEDKDAVITPEQMTYQDVLRMSIGPVEGTEGTIPHTSILAGQIVNISTLDNDLDFTDVEFPSPIHNADNVYMIAMLVDQKTGAIVNSNIVALGNPESIFTSVKDRFHLTPFADEGECRVLVTTDKPQTVSIELLNMEGKTVAMEKNYVEDNHTFTFNKRLPKGIYLVKGTAGEKVITQKIAF